MSSGDDILQLWRMKVAGRWVMQGSRVLDIGCHQGEFLFWLNGIIAPSVGFDPLFKGNSSSGGHQFFAQIFQEGLPFEDKSFDAITLLATIEHIDEKSVIARESSRLLRAGGSVIITVPTPLVDKILHFLIILRILDGMSFEEHHGFLPDKLPGIFIPEGFRLKEKQKFQFGLNNLYVFERL